MKKRRISILLAFVTVLALLIIPFEVAFAAPVAFAVTVRDSNSHMVYLHQNAVLTWTDASENGSTVRYTVARSITWESMNGFTNYVTFANGRNLTALTYTDTTVSLLPNGTRFSYKITASDGTGTTIAYSEPLVVYSVPPVFTTPMIINTQVNAGESIVFSKERLIDMLPAGFNGYILNAQVQAQDEDGTYADGIYREGIVAGISMTHTYYDEIFIMPLGDWATIGSRWRFRFRYIDILGNVGSWSEPTEYVEITEKSEHFLFPKDYLISEPSDVIEINGAITPAIVSAEVTLDACFVINPNAPVSSSRFITPLIRIRNLSAMPLEVSILSCRAAGNAPKVVEPDMFSLDQWSNLGQLDSKQFIALGMQSDARGSFWFKNETTQEAQLLGIFTAGEKSDYSLQARFGLAWKEQENYRYEMIFEIRLVP